MDKSDIDRARYSVLRIFEQLIDDISGATEITKFPVAELDETDIFCSLK